MRRATVPTALEQKSWVTLFFISCDSVRASSGTRRNLCGMRFKAADELKSQVSGLAMAAKA